MNYNNCIICRKKINPNEIHCSFFCQRVEYYRYKFKVPPQPIVLLNNYSKNKREMLAREEASNSELYISKKTKQIALP